MDTLLASCDPCVDASIDLALSGVGGAIVLLGVIGTIVVKQIQKRRAAK